MSGTLLSVAGLSVLGLALSGAAAFGAGQMSRRPAFARLAPLLALVALAAATALPLGWIALFGRP